jgi:hypothetical protein
MSRWGELIPHREDDPSCLCGCQDEQGTTEPIEPRTTRILVTVTWNDYDEDDREGRRYYYDDRVLFDTAGDWIAAAFEDRDDSPGIKLKDVTGADIDITPEAKP